MNRTGYYRVWEKQASTGERICLEKSKTSQKKEKRSPVIEPTTPWSEVEYLIIRPTNPVCTEWPRNKDI